MIVSDGGERLQCIIISNDEQEFNNKNIFTFKFARKNFQKGSDTVLQDS